MKRNLYFWQFIGFISTSIGGTLLHFLYEWTNESVIAAFVSGVNESTWEHMKLLFFPLFIFALVQRRFFGEYNNFWCVKLVGVIVGLLLIPMLFYTYNGAFGKSPDWLNITIFYVSTAIVFIVEAIFFKKGILNCKKQKMAFLLICFLGVIFIIFTFCTPQIPIFQDPITQTYGIGN